MVSAVPLQERFIEILSSNIDACNGWNFYNREHFFIQVIESSDPGRCWLLLLNPQHLKIVRDNKKDERVHNMLIHFITDCQNEEKSNHLLHMFDFQDNTYLIADLLPSCISKHFRKLDEKRMLVCTKRTDQL